MSKQYSGSIFTLNHYRKYFDITTNEFKNNCINSVNLIKIKSSPNSINYYQSTGDLYSCIWITATIIFSLYFNYSLVELLFDDSRSINFFNLILISINILYGYIIIVPLIFYIALRFVFKLNPNDLINPIRLISIYSYSLIFYLPISLINLISSILLKILLHKFTAFQTILSFVNYGLLSLGFILSGSSIALNLFNYLKIIDNDQKLNYIILGLAVLAHIGFNVLLKLYLF